MHGLLRALWNSAPLLLALPALFWAGNAVLGRAVAESFPPVALAQLRWLLAAAILLPFALPHLRRDRAAIRAHAGILALLAFTGITLFNTLQYLALNHTTALNVLLLQSSMPLLIAAVSFALYRDRLTPAQILGILTSLLGAVAIVTEGHPERVLGLRLNVGDAVFLVALLVYALYSALLKRRPPIHWMSLLAVTILGGAIMLLPAYAVEWLSGARPVWGPDTLLALAYVALLPSIVAYICFNRGVELIGPNRTGPYFHLVPLFGSVMAVLFLGEAFRWFHAAGAALILGGVALASRRPG